MPLPSSRRPLAMMALREYGLKRVGSLLAACAIAGLLVSGCAKTAASGEGADAKSTGPITDSDSSGLKPTAEPSTTMGDASKGATIFSANCSSCHGAAGAGGGIGPVLKGEKSRKDYAAAIAWIKNPQPPMPKLFPATLSETDVEDVASYVESL
jgi:mono/diheme cytochrome c family protein